MEKRIVARATPGRKVRSYLATKTLVKKAALVRRGD